MRKKLTKSKIVNVEKMSLSKWTIHISLSVSYENFSVDQVILLRQFQASECCYVFTAASLRQG